MFAVAPPPPPTTYVDAAGDSGTAPDITKITLGGAPVGRLVYIVVLATRYGAGSAFYVYLDTDRSTATGDPSGADFRLGPAGLEIWDDAAQDFEPTGDEDATFGVAPGGRALATSVAVADLGSPSRIDFVAESVDGNGGAGHLDTVAGVWATAAPLSLTAVQSPARAGGTWTIVVHASVPAAVTCIGSSGGTKLAVARHAGGICVFRVPKVLKGKKLRATVTATAAGRSTSKAFTATAK